MTRLTLILLAALLLTGCTTVRLPNAQTGKCYEVSHAYIIGWAYWLADSVDGWRCAGLRAGDEARPEK